MPALPTAILFDLDDTILSAYRRPEAAWLAVADELAELIAPLTPEAVAAAVSRQAVAFWADAERHRIWRQKLGDARRQIVSSALSGLAAETRTAVSSGAAVRLADRFTAYRDEQMHVFPGAYDTLDALRSAGVRLALITNGDGPGQRAKVERFDLARRFDHVQIEGEAGFGKPEPEAYRHALAALDVEPAETWMVGDNLEWEVAAPQRLGIYAIWHDHAASGLPPGSAVRPDRIITALPQLLEDHRA